MVSVGKPIAASSVAAADYGTLPAQEAWLGSTSVGIEYRSWWKNNGISASFSRSSTSVLLSNLLDPTVPPVHFRVHRYGLAGDYVRRFDTGRQSYYVKAGLGTIVWNGGSYAGQTAGFSNSFVQNVGAGADMMISRHLGLRIGYNIMFLRDASFSDPSFYARRTYIQEPIVGLTIVGLTSRLRFGH